MKYVFQYLGAQLPRYNSKLNFWGGSIKNTFRVSYMQTLVILWKLYMVLEIEQGIRCS